MHGRNKNVLLIFALLLFCGISLGEDYSLIQYLNVQSASAPVFSPDGRQIVYKTNISGVPQIWGQASFGSYQKQITFDTNGVAGVSWSPLDDKLMIVSIAPGGSERTQFYVISPYGSPLKQITSDSTAVYRMGPWTRSGERFAYASNARNKRDFDVYEYEIATGESQLVFQQEGTYWPASYSPDNRHLLIVREMSNVNSDLYLLDATTKNARLLTEHHGDVIYTQPIWNTDGKGFYFLTDRGREFTGIAYWPIDSTDFRMVETPDWDVEDLALSEDGSMMAWAVNENGISRFHFRDFRRGWESAPNRLPDGVVRDLTFSHDGAQLAFTFGSGARPNDVWVYDTNGDKMHQITTSATGGIPPTIFREPELVQYETFDGRKIPAYWYTPAKSTGKMPVIISIHGGPEAQARPMMSGLYHYLIQRGYAILEPNVRGSAGYGKSYLAMDDVHKRMDAVKDIDYAARWLSARTDVDAKKLVVFGGSYGGFMVLSAMTTYPDRWATGVSIVGISNFVTFLKNTSSYRRALREVEYGSLAADSAFLIDISPLSHVDKIKAPLFLIQGANDPRVPKTEADQMADAIRKQGGVVQYMLFEDEGHGLTKLKNRISAYGEVVKFLDKNVTNKK